MTLRLKGLTPRKGRGFTLKRKTPKKVPDFLFFFCRYLTEWARARGGVRGDGPRTGNELE